MDIFNRFKQVVKIREVIIDNEVFQLHYRVTALLLLGCAALVASKQHFGDPIDCIIRDEVPDKIMDTYCWIHATFTLPSACNKTVGIEVPHPCVDKYSSDKEDRVYHKYYQWVYFVLFFQAACFYAPHFFWKLSEGKLMLKLTAGTLKDPIYKGQSGDIQSVATYLFRHRFEHRQYFLYFVICEFCNFFNVILQVYIVDAFLGGTFTTYGLDVLNYIQMEQDDRVDPMVRVFPKMTKCNFHMFGPSGDVKKHDALCILPLNIINEKIYVVMWFWFVFLAFVTGAWLIYRVFTLFKPNLRLKMLDRRASLTGRTNTKNVLKRLDTGDWFVISMLCKNMEPQWFRRMMIKLRYQLENDEQGKEFDEISADTPLTVVYNE